VTQLLELIGSLSPLGRYGVAFVVLYAILCGVLLMIALR
jgi:hypothetical protein